MKEKKLKVCLVIYLAIRLVTVIAYVHQMYLSSRKMINMLIRKFPVEKCFLKFIVFFRFPPDRFSVLCRLMVKKLLVFLRIAVAEDYYYKNLKNRQAYINIAHTIVLWFCMW